MSATLPAPRPRAFLVLVKFTVDVDQLRADPVTRQPDLARAPLRINDFDENAIEAAVRLQADHGGRVLALSLAPHEPPRELVLHVLAMGVDEVHLVIDPAAGAWDSLATATVLAAAIRELAASEGVAAFDLVLCGDTSVDGLNSQTGPRVAEALDLASVTGASRLALEQGRLVADRTLEDRVDTVDTALPALVTVGMESNEPRLPTVLQIMSAGRKPVVNVRATCAIECEPGLQTRSVLAPPSRRKQILVAGDGPEELAKNLLRHLGEAGEVTV